MVYNKQQWNTNDPATPLSASRLNKLETQYDESKAYTDAQIAALPDTPENLADVAYSGEYSDLENRPYIPTVGDYATPANVTSAINALPTVAKTGAYADLSGKPTTFPPR